MSQDAAYSDRKAASPISPKRGAILLAKLRNAEQQATSNKQQATSNKQQATSNKQQATSNKQQATSRLYTSSKTPCQLYNSRKPHFQLFFYFSNFSYSNCGYIGKRPGKPGFYISLLLRAG